MTPTIAPDTTLIDLLCKEIRSCTSTSDGVEQPHAIVWTDPKEHWRTLIPELQKELPELLVLGEYDPDNRTGPAIWLRCVVDGALDDPEIPEGRVPIVYLPEVGRQDLRAGEQCDPMLQPLVELMFRGTLWLQRNGRDWTSLAFLTSEDTIGLEMRQDQQTLESMLRSLPEFARTALGQYSGKRLEAEDFDVLLATDVIRDLLNWMNAPETAQTNMGVDRWEAFCSRCRDDYAFDPESQGVLSAGERLGCGEGPWLGVWERFEEAPRNYRGIARLLKQAKPAILTLDKARWPEFNDDAESEVRQALQGLEELLHGEACDAILKLEEEHAPRRSWVWRRLGHSPMAEVLTHLAILAKHTKTSLGGQHPDEFASTYIERGWQADQAAWKAIAHLSSSDDVALVEHVVQQLLEPWTNDSARAFQAAVAHHPTPHHGNADLVEVAEHECLLFADGLRYDIAEALRDQLESLGCRVTLGHRWSALPSVTATAKPAVTPVANGIAGATLPADFTPTIQTSEKPANAPNLRSAMKDVGYQVLAGGMGDWPESDTARGWAEEGKIDTRGHQMQNELPNALADEVHRLAERIVKLLDAGWAGVRVVTDHGWLYLPEGLPKIDLPKHLTESKWARCATISGDSQVSVPRAPWHWNSTQHFATGPGISCFTSNNAYAHGGISLQECLIPDMTVERNTGQSSRASITSIHWKSMRCFIVGEASGTAQADLRLSTAHGDSVAASTKTLDDGSTSLILEDDEHETADLVVVLLDSAGNILAQHKTKVGIDS